MKLEVEDVHVAYGHSSVLFGVSLEVGEGELMCLMGRNGVGKTTLLNAIMGVLPVRSGRVLVDDVDVTRRPTWKRSMLGMGYVPQGHQVFPHLTTRENLQVVIERTRPRDTAAVDEALDLFPRLVPLLQRPAGLLSGGQAQQLAIARVLVTRPQLLILDEPTEGIQPSIILEIEDAIAELHRSSGMSILLVEQYVEFALRLAQRYAVMDGGRIEHRGDAADADPASFAELLVVWRTVHLTPREQERLMVSVAAMVARDRRHRGVVLNHPEAVALLTSFVLEGAREGRSVADLMDAGRRVLDRSDVMDGVPEMLTEVQVEATFPDGTKLVTIHHPIP